MKKNLLIMMVLMAGTLTSQAQTFKHQKATLAQPRQQVMVKGNYEKTIAPTFKNEFRGQSAAKSALRRAAGDVEADYYNPSGVFYYTFTDDCYSYNSPNMFDF